MRKRPESRDRRHNNDGASVARIERSEIREQMFGANAAPGFCNAQPELNPIFPATAFAQVYERLGSAVISRRGNDGFGADFIGDIMALSSVA
jgi:hypothetical protein